jgi:hypothetical protein
MNELLLIYEQDETLDEPVLQWLEYVKLLAREMGVRP